MKRKLLPLLLVLVLMMPLARAETLPPFYELKPLVTLKEGEEAVLALPISYYSGGVVYKGDTKTELGGACALHCAAVLLSNRFSRTVTAQETAKANNISITRARYWRAYVAWGKLEKAFDVHFDSFDMAQFGSRLKARGVKTAQRRQEKLNAVAQALDQYGQGLGLVIHFNSGKKLNGAGRRHAVVVMGYIKKDGVVTDLIVNDSSSDAPQGAAARLAQSVLPHSMLGEKGEKNADPETLPLLLMDYLVSYRWIE